MTQLSSGREYRSGRKYIRLFRPTIKLRFGTMLRTEIIQFYFNRTPLWLVPLRNWLFR